MTDRPCNHSMYNATSGICDLCGQPDVWPTQPTLTISLTPEEAAGLKEEFRLIDIISQGDPNTDEYRTAYKQLYGVEPKQKNS